MDITQKREWSIWADQTLEQLIQRYPETITIPTRLLAQYMHLTADEGQSAFPGLADTDFERVMDFMWNLAKQHDLVVREKT